MAKTIKSVKQAVTEEIWKGIEEFPRYEISNMGNVRTIENKEHMLATNVDKDGYPIVKMSLPTKRRTYRHIHILVAQAFLKKTETNNTIIHLDYDKNNNRVENLKYVSRSESCQHQLANKNNRNTIQASIRKVRCITEDKIFNSVREAARTYGIKSTTNISDVCNGKRKQAHGLVFEYVND